MTNNINNLIPKAEEIITQTAYLLHSQTNDEKRKEILENVTKKVYPLLSQAIDYTSQKNLSIQEEVVERVKKHPILKPLFSKLFPEITFSNEQRIFVRCDTGLTHWLTIRGTDPLSWYAKGVDMENVAANLWQCNIGNDVKAFEYKVLIDDQHWEDGENHNSQKEIVIVPDFTRFGKQEPSQSYEEAAMINAVYLAQVKFENTFLRCSIEKINVAQALQKAGQTWQVEYVHSPDYRKSLLSAFLLDKDIKLRNYFTFISLDGEVHTSQGAMVLVCALNKLIETTNHNTQLFDCTEMAPFLQNLGHALMDLAVFEPDVEQIIRILKVEKSLLLIPIVVSIFFHKLYTHMILVSLKSNGETCQLLVANSGGGVTQFHPHLPKSNRYQTVLEFNLPIELINEQLISVFVSKKIKTIDEFYKMLDKFESFQLDQRNRLVLFEQKQMGGTCMVQCLMAFMRYHCIQTMRGTEEEKIGKYRYFKALILNSLYQEFPFSANYREELSLQNAELNMENIDKIVQKNQLTIELAETLHEDTIWDSYLAWLSPAIHPRNLNVSERLDYILRWISICVAKNLGKIINDLPPNSNAVQKLYHLSLDIHNERCAILKNAIQKASLIDNKEKSLDEMARILRQAYISSSLSKEAIVLAAEWIRKEEMLKQHLDKAFGNYPGGSKIGLEFQIAIHKDCSEFL
jgi:hypothetical protein